MSIPTNIFDYFSHDGGMNAIDSVIKIKDNQNILLKNIILSSAGTLKKRVGYQKYGNTLISSTTDIVGFDHYKTSDTSLLVACAGQKAYYSDTTSMPSTSVDFQGTLVASPNGITNFVSTGYVDLTFTAAHGLVVDDMINIEVDSVDYELTVTEVLSTVMVTALGAFVDISGNGGQTGYFTRTSDTLLVTASTDFAVGDMITVTGYNRHFQVLAKDTGELTIDEEIQWSDSASGGDTVAVSERWTAFQLANADVASDTPFDINSSSLQSALHSVSLQKNLYLTNSDDEVFRFDGAGLFRAGWYETPAIVADPIALPKGSSRLDEGSKYYWKYTQQYITANGMLIESGTSPASIQLTLGTDLSSTPMTDRSAANGWFKVGVDGSTVMSGDTLTVTGGAHAGTYTIWKVDVAAGPITTFWVREVVAADAAAGDITTSHSGQIAIPAITLPENSTNHNLMYDVNNTIINGYRTLNNGTLYNLSTQTDLSDLGSFRISKITTPGGGVSRYYLMDSPDLSGLTIGAYVIISGCYDAINNGCFVTTDIDDTDKYIQVSNYYGQSSANQQGHLHFCIVDENDDATIEAKGDLYTNSSAESNNSEPPLAKYATVFDNKLWMANGKSYYEASGRFLIHSVIQDGDCFFISQNIRNQALAISGITNPVGTTFRYTFSGSPDLSDVIAGDYFWANDCNNGANDGLYVITDVDDSSDYIEITNASGVVDAVAAGTCDVAETLEVYEFDSNDTLKTGTFGIDISTLSYGVTSLTMGLSEAINSNYNSLVWAYWDDVTIGGLIAFRERQRNANAMYLKWEVNNYTNVKVNGSTVTSSTGYTSFYQISKPSRVWYSKDGHSESFVAPFDDSGGYWIDVNPDDGQEIMGILPIQNILLIFKQDSLYRISISGTDSYELQRVDPDVGCVAPRSLVNIQGKAFFLGRYSVHATDGFAVEDVGKDLKRYFENIDSNYIHLAACTNYVKDSQFRLSVPYKYETTSQTTNNWVFVFDYHANCWTVFDTHEVGIYTKLDDNLYFSTNSGFVYKVRNLGEASDYRDDAEAISAEIRTKWYDLGVPSSRKMFSHIIPQFYQSGLDSQAHIEYAYDFTTHYEDLGVEEAASSPWGHFSWGHSMWGDVQIFSFRQSLNPQKAQYVSFKFSNEDKDVVMELFGWSIAAKLLNDKGIGEPSAISAYNVKE